MKKEGLSELLDAQAKLGSVEVGRRIEKLPPKKGFAAAYESAASLAKTLLLRVVGESLIQKAQIAPGDWVVVDASGEFPVADGDLVNVKHRGERQGVHYSSIGFLKRGCGQIVLELDESGTPSEVRVKEGNVIDIGRVLWTERGGWE